MKKTTRFMSAVLAGIMAFGMAACGGAKTSETKTDSTKSSAAGETAVETTKAAGTESTGNKTVTVAITNAWASWCPYFESGTYTDIVSD